MYKLSVVGLGKLGLSLSLCFAARQMNVIGIDINKNIVNHLNKNTAPFYEPDLQDYINITKNKFEASNDIKRAIDETDATIILVGTPSDKDGNFSNNYIELALRGLSSHLKSSKKMYHLFIISSTVMPTSIEKEFIPLIEKESNRKLNKGFGICYVPDFVALGNVIEDFYVPDILLIGESDEKAGDIVESIYMNMIISNPKIARTSIINAELTKIIFNNFLTIKISFANMIGNLCDNIDGSDANVITSIIGYDKRISPLFMKKGLSYGGNCFPRDTKAYITLSNKYGCDTSLIESVDKINKYQDKLLLDKVLKESPKVVSILGLSFKPNTPVITQSPALKLINKLLDNNIKIKVYDDLVMREVITIYKERLTYCNSIEECIKDTDVCVITIPSERFKNLKFNEITTLIDCWNLYG